MKSRITSLVLFSVMFVLVGAALAMADKITLKDGTVLEGTVIKSANSYWFKGADGQRRQIDESEVASFEKTSGSSSSPGMPAVPHAAGSIDSVRARAEQVTTPIAAVSIWQEYIDSKQLLPTISKSPRANWKNGRRLEGGHAQRRSKGDGSAEMSFSPSCASGRGCTRRACGSCTRTRRWPP